MDQAESPTGGAQRGGGARVQERKGSEESSAEKGLGAGAVHSWLPEVGTIQDARCTRAAAPTCGWASKGGNPAVSQLAKPLSVWAFTLPEQALFLICRKAECRYTGGHIPLNLHDWAVDATFPKSGPIRPRQG